MAYKYVVFGQLIDGESTLKAIESVPTFYESPLSKVIMEQTGVINLEYQDIRISKHLNEYLHGHIEDLVALGDLLYAVSTVILCSLQMFGMKFSTFLYFIKKMYIILVHITGITAVSI